MNDSPVGEGDEVTRLYVQRHEKKSVRREELIRKFKKQNLFVTNFRENVTEDILRDFFAQYGQVRNVKILMKKTEINGEVVESSKCKGFVCFENPEDARKVLDESKNNGIWFDSKRLNLSMFEPRSERTQNVNNRGTASGNPEIDNIIMQFLQTMSTGGMMGGLPMMNNPSLPPGMAPQPNRNSYNKMPPQANTGMYGRPPPPQQPNHSMQSYQRNNFPTNVMGGNMAPNPGMPMMNPGFKDTFNQPPMPQPTMPQPTMGPAPMMPPTAAPQMPPISAMTEDSLYAHNYNELINNPEYQSLSEDEKRQKFGDLIYQYVDNKAGEINAPKITGMIIDLNIGDLEQSTATLSLLNEKISEGLSLLQEEEM